jgi:hypothetical protein
MVTLVGEIEANEKSIFAFDAFDYEECVKISADYIRAHTITSQ